MRSPLGCEARRSSRATSRIPNSRLRACVDAVPELAALNRLALGEAIRCFRLGSWDEAAGKPVSFREAKPLVRAEWSEPCARSRSRSSRFSRHSVR
jgi:hypothetical protein